MMNKLYLNVSLMDIITVIAVIAGLSYLVLNGEPQFVKPLPKCSDEFIKDRVFSLTHVYTDEEVNQMVEQVKQLEGCYEQNK